MPVLPRIGIGDADATRQPGIHEGRAMPSSWDEGVPWEGEADRRSIPPVEEG